MKYIISRVDEHKRCFYCEIEGREEGFYLPNRLAKVFLPHLNDQTMVEFVVLEKRKKHLNRFMYQISHFTFIASLNPYQVLYDLDILRTEMKKVLDQYDHFLFLDSEMTMPQYGMKSFRTEIIQVGYVLSNKKGDVLLNEGYYLLTKDNEPLNKRTKKFLSLDEDVYEKQAKPYQYFYDRLKRIITEYKCPIVDFDIQEGKELELIY